MKTKAPRKRKDIEEIALPADSKELKKLISERDATINAQTATGEEEVKPKKQFNLSNFLIPSLRRACYRYPPRSEALKLARVERGLYKCGKGGKWGCGGLYSRDFMVLDHDIPVVGAEGFTTWDEYIKRMFCSVDNFNCLCKPCHDQKSADEAHARKAYREAQKKLDKEKK